MESRKIKEIIILICTKLAKNNFTKLGKLILEINFGLLLEIQMACIVLLFTDLFSE